MASMGGRPNFGPIAQARTKRLFKAMLAYANDELEDGERLTKVIQVHWITPKQLVVRTQVRFLEHLTALDSDNGKLDTEQIKEALKRLKDFLKILVDNRTQLKGAADWHFTLNLWHERYELAANLKKFDEEWERLRPEKSKQLIGKGSDNLSQPHRQSPDIHNDTGVANYLTDRLPLAVSDFTKALELDPNFAETHYNLGTVYEDLHDFDRARFEYRLAMLGGLAAAYNTQARLYILEKNYTAAVDLLLKGLSLAEHDAEKYALHKNLGWARLGQERYAEAKGELLTAIDLNGEQASAYGLLAQALEGLGERENALVAWENCLRYASSYRPDEDTWIDLARQRLAQADNQQ
jgi:Flp pilus assembly protein TadD